MYLLEYLGGSVPNNWYSQGKMGLAAPVLWFRQVVVPEDIDCIYAICLDGFVETENVAHFTDEEARIRWEMLAGRCEPPKGMDMRTAVAFAEAIWLSVLSGDDHEVGDGTEVRDAFRNEAATRLASVRNAGSCAGWKRDGAAGYAEGADYLVEAWAAGAPIETVLMG